MIFSKRDFIKVNYITNRIHKDNWMNVCGNYLKRINNRGAVKKSLNRHLPYLGKISKSDI